ncbi:MAG TPA: hypothetical protein PLU22_20225 [Polyangiaceae bacterium]|nr:hypothetical protein [Polyangiaceae bacterium]
MFLPRRLDKYLRDTTLFSAARAREALAAGRVCVAGPGARARRSGRPPGGRHRVLQRQLAALAAAAHEARTDGRPRRHLERWLEQHATTAVPATAVPAAAASLG